VIVPAPLVWNRATNIRGAAIVAAETIFR